MDSRSNWSSDSFPAKKGLAGRGGSPRPDFAGDAQAGLSFKSLDTKENSSSRADLLFQR
jgi:hypothetical protein